MKGIPSLNYEHIPLREISERRTHKCTSNYGIDRWMLFIVSRIAYAVSGECLCVWNCDRSLWFIRGQFIISLTMFSLSFHVCALFLCIEPSASFYWITKNHIYIKWSHEQIKRINYLNFKRKRQMHLNLK